MWLRRRMDRVQRVLEHIGKLLFDIYLLLLVKCSSFRNFRLNRYPFLILKVSCDLTLFGAIRIFKAFETILIIMHHLRFGFPILWRIVAIIDRLIEILIPLLRQHIQGITHQHLLLETYSILFLCLCIEFNHSSDYSSTGCPAHHSDRVSWLLWVILWLWMSSTWRYCSEGDVAVHLFFLLLLTVVPQLLVGIRQSWLRLFEGIQWRIHRVVFDWSHYLNFLSLLLEVTSVLLLFRVVAGTTVVIALILLLRTSACLDLDVLLILIFLLMFSYIAIIIWLDYFLCGSFIYHLGLISCLLQLHFLHCFQLSHLAFRILWSIWALLAVLWWWLGSTWCRIRGCSAIVCEYSLDFLRLLICESRLIIVNPIPLTHGLRISREGLVHHRIRRTLLLPHILCLLARRLRFILHFHHLHIILVLPMLVLSDPRLVLVVYSLHVSYKCLFLWFNLYEIIIKFINNKTRNIFNFNMNLFITWCHNVQFETKAEEMKKRIKHEKN